MDHDGLGVLTSIAKDTLHHPTHVGCTHRTYAFLGPHLFVGFVNINRYLYLLVQLFLDVLSPKGDC